MTELLTLSESTTQFDCDVFDDAGNKTGDIVTYYLEESLSIERFRMLQKFQREIATGLTHFDLIQLLKNNVTHLNQAMKGGEVLAQMSFENINALNHAGSLEEKEPFAVWLCTLVLNTKNEDRRKFEVGFMQQKIRTWEANGIAIAFFLTLAEQYLGVPSGALQPATLTYSEPAVDPSTTPAEVSPAAPVT